MSSVSVKIGGKATAVATATPTDPAVVLPAATYVWTSSDPTLATVDAGGIITAIAIGSVLISANTTIDGVEGTGSAGLDVVAAGNPFSVSVVITAN